MTYDPSMTIVSILPTQEGSDNPAGRGKNVALPMTEGGNIPHVPDTPLPDMVKTDGGKTFDIYLHFS